MKMTIFSILPCLLDLKIAVDGAFQAASYHYGRVMFRRLSCRCKALALVPVAAPSCKVMTVMTELHAEVL